ncbi:ABC transporter substrate-binding protein [Frankia sp. Cppng1_Ct_nod]|uniref:ABC transporter substrate-binding protein n=1 Tax=Frankia sp. Cppng1_Ct_nod TaxID=2897162 RepID=UPI0020252A63|nr:ABC transporter substrate-binding protein [Frankia sp. Cppng1_Ct_nod]
MIARHLPIRVSIAVTATAVALAACGSSGSAGSAPAATGAASGNAANAANASLSPVTIGLINQQGGEVGYPDLTDGANVAVTYVNAELGGIGGHPLKLATCFTDGTPAKSQSCAQQFLNDSSINMVSTGTLSSGDGPIWTTLAGKKPIIGGFPATQGAFNASDAYFFASGSPGVLSGMASFTRKTFPQAKKVAAVYVDLPSLKSAIEGLIKPQFDAAGISLSEVPVGITATDAVAPLTAAGADKADVVMVLGAGSTCIQVANALQQLSVNKPVVGVGNCQGPDVRKAAASAIDGWYIVEVGADPADTANVDVRNTLAAFDRYGKDKNSGAFSVPEFGSVVAIAKILQGVGYDKLSPDTIRAAVKAFRGPVPVVAPQVQCGSITGFPSLCDALVRVYQVKGKSVIDSTGGQYLNGLARD